MVAIARRCGGLSPRRVGARPPLAHFVADLGNIPIQARCAVDRLNRVSVPTATQRKVRQLENDVEAIYEMLGRINGMQMRQANRLEEIAERQDHHSATLDEHSQTLAGHSETLAGHTQTLAGHTQTLAEHGAKLDEILAILRDGRGC